MNEFLEKMTWLDKQYAIALEKDLEFSAKRIAQERLELWKEFYGVSDRHHCL